jgi:hypothetical protein
MDIRELWNKIMGLYHYTPKRIKILPANTDHEAELNVPFEEDKHYFDIVVNEMFLSTKNNKNWLHNYDPMVFVTTEFQYNHNAVSVPFVIGPSIGLQGKKQDLPKDGGMIYKNIPVGGRNPYKGGSLAISLILNQFPYESPLKRLLGVIETASKAYSTEIFPVLGNYLKIANILIDGLDALAESDNIKPLIGVRENYRDGGIKPGYFALINVEDDVLKQENFFVIDEELRYGDSKQSARPFRSNDYVLYSILREEKRSDYESLPYYKSWEELVKFIDGYALSSDNKSLDITKLKREANGRLFSLGNTMDLSADLTGTQAALLYEIYFDKMNQLIGKKERLSGREEHYKEEQKPDWKKKIEHLNDQLLN